MELCARGLRRQGWAAMALTTATDHATLTLPDPCDGGSPPPLEAGRHELSVGIEPGDGFTDDDPHNNRLALSVEIPAKPEIEPISLACRTAGEGA